MQARGGNMERFWCICVSVWLKFSLELYLPFPFKLTFEMNVWCTRYVSLTCHLSRYRTIQQMTNHKRMFSPIIQHRCRETESGNVRNDTVTITILRLRFSTAMNVRWAHTTTLTPFLLLSLFIRKSLPFWSGGLFLSLCTQRYSLSSQDPRTRYKHQTYNCTYCSHCLPWWRASRSCFPGGRYDSVADLKDNNYE